MNPKEVLKNLFLNGLAACSPENALREVFQVNENIKVGDREIFYDSQPIYVLASGKASISMYRAVSDLLGNRISNGLVISEQQEEVKRCSIVNVVVANHPVPGEHSAKAGRRVVSFLKEIPSNGILFYLISGGTSSLVCLPADGISIEDLGRMFELLNHSGATIKEMNTVRKHCSQIKGGQLLRYLDPEIQLFTLAISDVPNDDLSVIGSGPTIPDSSTYKDAYDILKKYDLWDRMAKSVNQHINKGMLGERKETVKPGESLIQDHHSMVVSSGNKLSRKIALLGKEMGLNVCIEDTPFNANVEEVASSISDVVLPELSDEKSKKTSLFIFWGESTIQVTGDGKGGRNQELALRGACKIAGHEHITWLSAGTDGIDGPTDAAGAIVDGETISKARERGIDPEEYMRNNDSYHFHLKMDTLLKTGSTGNNLMDIVIVLNSSKDSK